MSISISSNTLLSFSNILDLKSSVIFKNCFDYDNSQRSKLSAWSSGLKSLAEVAFCLGDLERPFFSLFFSDLPRSLRSLWCRSVDDFCRPRSFCSISIIFSASVSTSLLFLWSRNFLRLCLSSDLSRIWLEECSLFGGLQKWRWSSSEFILTFGRWWSENLLVEAWWCS